MAKYLFMSDAHIGAQEFDLEEGLIAIIENGYKKIYFLGDIIDTWEMPLNKILSRYSHIIECLRRHSDRIVFVAGNHDPSVDVLKTIFPKMEIFSSPHVISLNGYKTVLIHGHEYDAVLLIYKVLMMSLLDGIYYLGRCLGKDWKKDVRRWYYMKKYKRFSYNIITKLEKDTIEKMKKNCEIVIMGHTHTPKIINVPDCRYINCGNLLVKPTYIEYDDETNKFNLVKI